MLKVQKLTKMLDHYNEFDNCCLECASFILDSGDIQVSYKEHIKNHNDPRNHIFYCANLVLGKMDVLQKDIMDYEKWTS